MAYADYAYYTTAYLGTTISEADFPRLSLRASSYLDYYTQGRAGENPDLDALKMACCAVSEQMQLADIAQETATKSLSASLSSAGLGELQSQSVGSWSKTYRSGGESAQQALTAAQTAKAALTSAANQYLAGTGLLYRGGACKCPCSPTL